MRRSVRDAIVGFTVIGGIIGFASTALWLRGVRLGASHWSLTARLNDAAGLMERSPVTYRGILVGSVRSVEVTSEAVLAELEINKAAAACYRHGRIELSGGGECQSGIDQQWNSAAEGCTPPTCVRLSANSSALQRWNCYGRRSPQPLNRHRNLAPAAYTGAGRKGDSQYD